MAEMDLALSVAKLVDELHKAGTPPSEGDLGRLAEVIARGFKVSKGEVAILRLLPETRILSFLFPIKLASVGSIPLTTTHSLAAKNVRDRRGEIVNNFPTYKHPTVFEAVDLIEGEKAMPIQKIMSSPMMVEGKVIGVIQVSRKGRPGEAAGPDFTSAELAQLAAVGSMVGKYLAEATALTPARAKPPARD